MGCLLMGATPNLERGVSPLSCSSATYGCKNWIIRKLSAEELMLWNCGIGEDS